MKYVPITDPHRQKHFDFFNQMAQPHFSLCALVDISRFLTAVRSANGHFTSCVAYVVSAAANGLPHFRRRIREGQMVEHEVVHPSFTVPTRDSEAFSFCTVPFQGFAPDFLAEAQAIQERMYDSPSFENEPGRDDYLFLSAIPWVAFTSFQHAMSIPADSVPRIVWGKYHVDRGKTWMPLSVQVHHAIMDGRHVGAYFDAVQRELDGFGEKI